MANKRELDIAFAKYVERMNQVSQLSAPSLDAVTDADDYSRLLLYNFRKIGELAGENREMIDQVFMPLINKEEPLTEDEINALEGLNDLLINMRIDNATDVDTHLAELSSERVERERSKEDGADVDVASDDVRIRMLDKNIDITCQKMVSCVRSNNYEEGQKTRESGIRDYQKILSYLDKERFLSLSDEARDLVLTNTYFGANLYDCYEEKKMLEMLAYARSIMEDPFYRNAMPGHDLRRKVFRTYEYAAEMSYYDDYKFQDTYRVAYENACKLEELWKSDPEYYEDLMKKETISNLCLYGAAKILDPSLERRLDDAAKLFEEREFSDYSYAGLISNLDTAVMLYEVIEIARKTKKIGFPERFLRLQRQIPFDFISYLYRVDNVKLSAWLLTAVGNLAAAFREVPGGMKGGELFLKAIVALHPPTYVHSFMVARITLCLVRNVLERKPELFVDHPGCGTVEAVLEKKDEILDYAYHAALYHDLGKLLILDTIAMYGRKLLDSEFHLIKMHPDNGAQIAERLPSLKPYADVIRGHHVWYDGSNGYPLVFNVAESPYKTIIQVVMAADCLDAATDRVGRSYHKGETFEEYKKEIREGAGSHYAPWLPEILEDAIVDADLKYLLDEGRRELYRDTFRLLKDISQIRK